MKMEKGVVSCQLPVASKSGQGASHWQLTTNNWQLRRRGFSFVEILFAVMILGIGFIMIAAMFPVAIQQTEANNQETICASIGRAGEGYMTQVALMNWPPMPPVGQQPVSLLLPTFTAPLPNTAIIPTGATSVIVPGQVWTMYDMRDTYSIPLSFHRNLLWAAVSSNMIQPGDPRFAWVAMYKRDLIGQGAPGLPAPLSFAPYAQVILVGVQSRNKQLYDQNLDVPSVRPNVPPPNTPLLPQLLTAGFTPPPNAASPALVKFNAGNIGAVGEGAYVVVSDAAGGNPTAATGIYNGRIYRIGVARPDVGPTVYELAPGQGLEPTDAPYAAQVLVVGRGVLPGPNSLVKQFSGLVQDVAVYTTYVQVPN